MHYRQLLSAIAQAHTSAVRRAAAAVNQGLVLRNWLVGAYVVEFEQGGEDRAKYGAKLLPRLARDLKDRGLPGLGSDVLERTRNFYLSYPQVGGEISATLPRKLEIPAKAAAVEISSSLMTKSRVAKPILLSPTISAPVERKLGGVNISAPVGRKSHATDLPTPLSAQQVISLG